MKSLIKIMAVASLLLIGCGDDDPMVPVPTCPDCTGKSFNTNKTLHITGPACGAEVAAGDTLNVSWADTDQDGLIAGVIFRLTDDNGYLKTLPEGSQIDKGPHSDYYNGTTGSFSLPIPADASCCPCYLTIKEYSDNVNRDTLLISVTN